MKDKIKHGKYRVTISTIEDQHGEQIPEKTLILDFDREVVILRQLNCYSSADLGLGICQCESHPIYTDKEYKASWDLLWLFVTLIEEAWGLEALVKVED